MPELSWWRPSISPSTAEHPRPTRGSGRSRAGRVDAAQAVCHHSDIAFYATAEALHAYLREKGNFPRGTMPRPRRALSEACVVSQPAPELDVELLPYLPRIPDLLIRPDLWDEGDNLRSPRAWSPSTSECGRKTRPRCSRVSGQARPLASTQLRWRGRVGMNAPETFQHPKASGFGYDRFTRQD